MGLGQIVKGVVNQKEGVEAEVVEVVEEMEVVEVVEDTVPPFDSSELFLHRHLPQLHHQALQLAVQAVVGQI